MFAFFCCLLCIPCIEYNIKQFDDGVNLQVFVRNYSGEVTYKFGPGDVWCHTKNSTKPIFEQIFNIDCIIEPHNLFFFKDLHNEKIRVKASKKSVVSDSLRNCLMHNNYSKYMDEDHAIVHTFSGVKFNLKFYADEVLIDLPLPHESTIKF